MIRANCTAVIPGFTRTHWKGSDVACTVGRMSALAVLGTGRVGTNLAAGLADAGHEVTVGTRDETVAKQRWTGPAVTFADHASAARGAGIVINATPGDTSVARLSALHEELAGRILVDVANATVRDQGGTGFALVYPNSSLGEHLQRALPETRVVKTLNSMMFSVMTDPHATAIPPVAFLSGDDPDAKATTATLLADLGWPADWIQDLGDITTARGPEAFMLLAPHIGRSRGIVPFGMSIAI